MCEKSFTSSSNLKLHINTHSNVPKSKINCFIHECDRIYLSLETLKKHIQKTHNPEYEILKQTFPHNNFTDIYQKIKSNNYFDNSLMFIKFKNEDTLNLNHIQQEKIHYYENNNESISNKISYESEIKNVPTQKSCCSCSCKSEVSKNDKKCCSKKNKINFSTDNNFHSNKTDNKIKICQKNTIKTNSNHTIEHNNKKSTINITPNSDICIQGLQNNLQNTNSINNINNTSISLNSNNITPYNINNNFNFNINSYATSDNYFNLYFTQLNSFQKYIQSSISTLFASMIKGQQSYVDVNNINNGKDNLNNNFEEIVIKYNRKNSDPSKEDQKNILDLINVDNIKKDKMSYDSFTSISENDNKEQNTLSFNYMTNQAKNSIVNGDNSEEIVSNFNKIDVYKKSGIIKRPGNDLKEKTKSKKLKLDTHLELKPECNPNILKSTNYKDNEYPQFCIKQYFPKMPNDDVKNMKLSKQETEEHPFESFLISKCSQMCGKILVCPEFIPLNCDKYMNNQCNCVDSCQDKKEVFTYFVKNNNLSDLDF